MRAEEVRHGLCWLLLNSLCTKLAASQQDVFTAGIHRKCWKWRVAITQACQGHRGGFSGCPCLITWKSSDFQVDSGGHCGQRISTPIVMAGCQSMAVLMGPDPDFQICCWLLVLPDSHTPEPRHLLDNHLSSWFSIRRQPDIITSLGKWPPTVLSPLCYTLPCHVFPVPFSWASPDLKGSGGLCISACPAASRAWLGTSSESAG